MDLLQAEIHRKRKANSDIRTKFSNDNLKASDYNGLGSEKDNPSALTSSLTTKFIRQKDLQHVIKADIQEQQAALDLKRKKRELDTLDTNRSLNGKVSHYKILYDK